MKTKNTQIPLDRLEPYRNQPFHPLDADSFDQLVDSITEVGLINPIVVRPIVEKEGMYQIIAGHNRFRAFAKLGRDKIPAVVMEMDDSTADLMVVDSNLKQRGHISKVELGRAYRLQLQALKRQGQRTDLTSSQSGTKCNADEQVARRNNTSRNNVHRLIRLTYLIESLAEKVESGDLPFGAGVELSYLTAAVQSTVYQYHYEDNDVKLDQKTAKDYRRRFEGLSDIVKDQLDTKFPSVDTTQQRTLSFTVDVGGLMLPNPQRLQQDFEAFLQKKYGGMT